MKTTSVALIVLKAAIATALLLVSTTILFGQEKEKLEKLEKLAHMGEKMAAKDFCSGENWSNGDKVSVRDLREVTIPASGSIAIDGGKNGGIKVKGSNRADIVVRACVQAWGTSEEAARGLANSIKISTVGTIKADAPEDNHWGVSFEVLVPRSTDLNLRAHNGGIGISGVEGKLEFETLNGGVSLMEVAGDVRGRTTNGGVTVKFGGTSWKGAGLEVITTNGGVHLWMPENYAANVETGTTNGGFRSDFAALNVSQEEKGNRYHKATRVNAALNGGGAPIRVITTNGGVSISSSATKASY